MKKPRSNRRSPSSKPAAGDVGRPGTVVEMHGVRATVLIHAGQTGEGDRVRCRLPRKRLTTVVGDRVHVVDTRHGPQIGEVTPRDRSVTRSMERRTRIMATHVDRLIIVSSVSPLPRPALIDRILVGLEGQEIEVVLVVNKCDLPGADAAIAMLDEHAAMGSPVLRVSAATGEGLDSLAALLVDGLSVIIGHSGVGKSTLLNRLSPGAELKTNEVNALTGKGRHTTTVSTCHVHGGPWPQAGLIVDTPGIRAWPLASYGAIEIARSFAGIQVDGVCRFSDCLHESEPDCQVRAAVDAETIDPRRYTSYCKLMAGLREELDVRGAWDNPRKARN